jgi:hypothetical protein
MMSPRAIARLLLRFHVLEELQNPERTRRPLLLRISERLQVVIKVLEFLCAGEVGKAPGAGDIPADAGSNDKCVSPRRLLPERLGI